MNHWKFTQANRVTELGQNSLGKKKILSRKSSKRYNVFFQLLYFDLLH